LGTDSERRNKAHAGKKLSVCYLNWLGLEVSGLMALLLSMPRLRIRTIGFDIPFFERPWGSLTVMRLRFLVPLEIGRLEELPHVSVFVDRPAFQAKAKLLDTIKRYRLRLWKVCDVQTTF
jgi:hypothetical protein